MQMKRFLITLIVVVTLAVTFRVYSAIIIPLTEIRENRHPLAGPLETQLHGPALFDQKAAEIFPEAPWTHRAEQTWLMGEHAYLYFKHFERVPGSGNSILISPVAIFWNDPKRPGAPPFRLQAERAQIKFQNSFFDAAIALSNANPGRIVWASMEGNVHVDGPDGLQLHGQNFKFEEDSSQLYSDHAISFAYGPTEKDQRRITGTADQIQLTFEPSHESILGKDMPRVGGLSQILLRRNVAIDLEDEQQGKRRRSHLRSDGAFLYDVVKREATLDDNVRVTHLTDPDGAAKKDSIECAWLKLLFDSAKSENLIDDEDPAKAFDGLVFRSLMARGSENGRGRRLKVTSDEHQLAAVMQDLSYDAALRRAILVDQEQVIIHRGEMKFACPQIGIQHTPRNQIEYLECRGPGQMDVMQADTTQPPMIVRWNSRVQVRPDPVEPVHQIRIEDQALMGIPGQFGISADLIHIWADLDRLPQSGGRPGSSGGLATSAGPRTLAGPLPVKRARAEKNVRLTSSQLVIERSNLIDVRITPGVLKGSTLSSSPVGQRSDSIEQQRAENPWLVSADTLAIDLIHDPVQSAIDLSQASGEGNILIQHDPGQSGPMPPASTNGPLVIKGRTLLAQNQGGIRQILTVKGEIGGEGDTQEYASISMGQATIRGGHITLVRHENRADVLGPGGLSVQLPNSMNGKSNSGKATLDIVWQEGMSFDGLAARFWGKVTAALPGEQQSVTRLLCEDLTATINQRISFAEPDRATPDLTISEVEARHNVVLESFEFQQNALTAVRKSRLSNFKVNMNSGDFKGDGPGELQSWSLGDAVRFSPVEGPQANQPAKPSETKWRYSNVRFAGMIDGNINRNDATLHQRVEVLTAPVEMAQARFTREQLSEKTPEAANAVWMKCDQMRIIQKPGPSQSDKSYEVFAIGNTELEGHVFRAVADELTFDERYGLFTLRGLGKDAHLYHQAQPGQAVSPTAARQIRFVPVKREIVIDGSSGISGSY